MKAIYNREMKSYFNSPLGYIFVGVFIALCSFFFVNGALMYQIADLNMVFSNISVVYLFLISMLTMGLFSAERSRKTDQLLLTSPVTVPQIVLGKYFAAMGVFGTTLILSLIYPIILNFFGSPSPSEMIGIYIGFILLWGSFIAIGTFISALTENQVIAAVVTFGVLLIVYFLNSLAGNVTNKTVQTIIRWLSITGRYAEFQSGILNFVDVIYYLSFITAFLFLTVQVIKRRQYSDRKFRVNNSIISIAVIAAIILVNAIASTIATKLPLKVDLTRNSVYEYSENTKEVLAELKDDIEIYALYPDSADGTYVNTVREYLDQYQQMSNKIKVEFRDPYEDPAFVRGFGDNIETGSLIVKSGDRSRVVPYSKLYTQNQYTGSTSIDAEKLLTSAIRYVSGAGQEINAYFIKGHNEYAGGASSLAQSLKSDGYTVNEISLATDEIPENASLLISLVPSVDFSPEEINALDAYMQKGGSLAFAFSAGIPTLSNTFSYLSEWGINVNSDFVIENDSSMALRSQTGVPVPAPKMEEHAVTEKLSQNDIPIITPGACSITLSNNNPQYATTTALLKTSKNSWGKTDMSSQSLEKATGDNEGPLTVAAISENGEKNSKIFVIGSVQAIEVQGLLDNSSYSNGDFILNSLSYISGKDDSLNIRAKIISADSLTMTERQVSVVGIIVQYVIPLLIIAIGLITWLRRRYL